MSGKIAVLPQAYFFVGFKIDHFLQLSAIATNFSFFEHSGFLALLMRLDKSKWDEHFEVLHMK